MRPQRGVTNARLSKYAGANDASDPASVAAPPAGRLVVPVATRMKPGSDEGITRRAFIGGSAGVVLLGAGAVAGVHALQPSPQPRKQPQRKPVSQGGKLVPALLAANPFTVAHRGGSDDWPEMSMEAYRDSVARHVDALEISLARTVDGVWFGLHDDTLDRTSGTHGFVASEHTWKEVQQHRITIRPPAVPAKVTVEPQPYLRLEELIAAYGATHTIFVDPKTALYRYYADLFAILESGVKKPAETFIAKSYCGVMSWADAARQRGYKSWGFYYGATMKASPSQLATTQSHWDLLGLDYSAPASAWQEMRQYKKPIIGHVIPNKAAAHEARSMGAQGLMISGIVDVLG